MKNKEILYKILRETKKGFSLKVVTKEEYDKSKLRSFNLNDGKKVLVHIKCKNEAQLASMLIFGFFGSIENKLSIKKKISKGVKKQWLFLNV